MTTASKAFSSFARKGYTPPGYVAGIFLLYNMLMEKKLHSYIDYINKESKHPNAELIKYHKTMVQQFQHERLIHLIVTMFFSLFMILFFVLFLILTVTLPSGESTKLILGVIGGITLALLVTTLLYVRHYYILENGTQELEDITKKLYGR